MLSPLAFTNPQPIFFDDAMLASLGLTADVDVLIAFAAPLQAFADDDADDEEDKDGDDEEDEDDLDEEDDAEDDEEDAEDDEEDEAEDDTEEDDAEDDEETEETA